MNIDRACVPPSTAVDVPEIKQTLARWETARDAARDVDRRLVLLQRGTGRQQAEARDAEALAAALEAGKPAPRARHVVAFEQELSVTEREAKARGIVEQRAWANAAQSFEQHAAELRALTDGLFEQRRAAFLKTVDALEHALAQLEQVDPMKLFLADTGMGSGIYRAAPANASVSTLISAVQPHPADDTRCRASDAIAAMREIGAPPKPVVTNPHQLLSNEERAQPLHRPLSQQGVVGGIGVPGFSVEGQ